MADLDTLIAALTKLRTVHGNIPVLVYKDSADSLHPIDGGPRYRDRDSDDEALNAVVLYIND